MTGAVTTLTHTNVWTLAHLSAGPTPLVMVDSNTSSACRKRMLALIIVHYCEFGLCELQCMLLDNMCLYMYHTLACRFHKALAVMYVLYALGLLLSW